MAEKDSVRMPRVTRRDMTCAPGCAVEAALQFIDGKWKGVILFHLLEDGITRFNALHRRFPGLTPRMLTAQLRDLEACGLIERVVYPQVPPRVEYGLTPLGRTLEPALRTLKSWGETHAPDVMAKLEADAARAA